MKPILLYPLIFLTVLANNAHAQSIEEQMTRIRPSCHDVFANAVLLLPKLYRQNAFDSMEKAIEIWQDACGNNREVQCTKLLLAMQEGHFSMQPANNNLVELLEDYARLFPLYQRTTFQNLTTEKAFYSFCSIWAKFLLQQQPRLNDNEKLICGVFKGEVTDPLKEVKNNREKYPELAVQLHRRQEGLRKGVRGNLSFITGIWIPRRDLKILGNHPSVGFQAGSRNNHNQLDVTMQFRFSQPAHPYFVNRDNVLYESTHYFGGYIGIDYAYYFVSKEHYDLGILTGIGLDGFDVTDGQNNGQNNSIPNPTSINSFNANGGLKCNVYLTPTFYLGIQGRYNLVNYCNSGGTSLQGNTFSIDFIIGGNRSRY